MSVHPITRPTAGSEQDYEELGKAMDRKHRTPKYNQTMHNDSFAKFFAWCGVILAALMTAAICWGSTTLISVQKDIAVLLARPEGVSKAEFDREANRWDAEINELKRQERERARP